MKVSHLRGLQLLGTHHPFSFVFVSGKQYISILFPLWWICISRKWGLWIDESKTLHWWGWRCPWNQFLSVAKPLFFWGLVLTPGGLWSTCHISFLCLRASTLGIFLHFLISHSLGMWRNENRSPLASWPYIPECLVGFQLENVCLLERKLSSQPCRWGPASLVQVNDGGHLKFTLND